MKKNILLYILLLGLSTPLYIQCTTEKDMTISDEYANNVPENVYLLEYNRKSVTIAWDFIPTAKSYTVQLLDSQDSNNPIQTHTTNNEDYYEFSGLNERKSYYARVRANFTNSATSNWVYVKSEDSSPARIIPKYGIVASDFEIQYIKKINESTSTITAEWSFTDFDNSNSEVSKAFQLSLYKDQACTDLEINWSSVSGIFAASTATTPKPLRFTFSGLVPNTDYYLVVKDIAGDITTPPVKFTTKASGPTASNAPSNPGDIILHEEFNKFIHGGDILYKAGGYLAGTTGRSEWIRASGENPINTITGISIVDLSNEFNVFDGGSVARAYTIGVGMENWGKSGNTSTRPGYMKIGGGSGAVGKLYTPKLNYTGNTTSIEITFKAAVYTEVNTNYCDDIIVEAIDNVNFGTNGAESTSPNKTVKSTQKVNIANSIGKFDTYTITIDNVNKDSRICFSSDSQSTKTRFLLDDITIKIK